MTDVCQEWLKKQSAEAIDSGKYPPHRSDILVLLCMATKVLIIDDEESLRKLMGRIIRLEGFDVDEADSIKAGSAILKSKQIDVVLCDVKLPDGNGVSFVKEMRTSFPGTECILLTAYGNIADGVQAIKNGAFDYITKGNDNERIIPLLHQAAARAGQQRASAVKIKISGAYRFADVIGKSPAIEAALSLARKIAPTDVNVLLLGETGTGKEVFAGAIHSAGKRASQPFIALNCSAFTRDLLEGELFGHKAGAYTSASKDKKGLIELADNGTLFLDEIGEMNLELQAKLLRVLENGEFIKLGDERTTRVNLRVIAATNRNLEEEIAAGRFRQDLFYRLNGFAIELPPLRERTEDIPLLAAHLLNRYAQKEQLPDMQITASAMQLLQQHDWKGNIRELKSVLERAAILAENNLLEPAHLPYEIQRQDQKHTPSLTLASVERAHIQKVLARTQGNKAKAAAYLGIGLSTLYRKIEEYNIS